MNTTEPKTVLEQFTVIKRGISYSRVSTDEQADKGFSLPTQLKEIQAYAAKNGIELVKDFYDDFTGSSLNRDGLKEGRQWLRSGKADCIICLDSDRLTREPSHYMLLRDEFKESGTELHYAKRGKVDLNDFGQMLVEDFYGRFAHEWKRKLIEATSRGKRGKAESGSVVLSGRPPYGYTEVKIGSKVGLEINEDEAVIVRLIFRLYVVEDYSINGIASHLTKLRIPTRADNFPMGRLKKRGIGEWYMATVAKILANETYRGTWYYSKIIPVTVPQIIDNALWSRAQIRRNENREHRRRQPKHEYLLSGRGTCDLCQSFVYGETVHQGRYSYYRCATAKGVLVTKCSNRYFYFPVVKVDTAVWEWVKGLIVDPAKLEAGLKRYQERMAHEAAPLKAEIARLNKSIEKLKARLVRARNLYLDGDEEKAVYLVEKRNLESDVARLESDLTESQAQLDNINLSPERKAEIHELAALVREGLDILDKEPILTLKRRIINRLNIKIRLAVEDKVKIVHASCVLDSKTLELSSMLSRR